MTSTNAETLRDRLSRALPAAIKARDRLAVTALRSALAAIDNAQAVDAPQASPGAGPSQLAGPAASQPEDAGTGAAPPERDGAAAGHPDFAGTVAGLGATEVARRSLTEAQVEEIVRTEIADREAAAAGYERGGQPKEAERLRGEAKVLGAYLDRA
jgi:uncharacterized protein YqeY